MRDRKQTPHPGKIRGKERKANKQIKVSSELSLSAGGLSLMLRREGAPVFLPEQGSQSHQQTHKVIIGSI